MRSRQALLLLLAAAVASAASAASLHEVAPTAVLLESFDAGWGDKWVHSSADKYTGVFEAVGNEDAELRVPEKSQHYGLTALLPQPLDPSEGLVVQYEATYTSGYNCGGSYVKLLTHADGFKAEDLVDTTPYTIMFGPDKCGDPNGKIHLILRHRSPVTGEVEEKHLKPHPHPIVDALPHVYTLVIKPDNTFEVLVDGEVRSSGSLFESLEPSINPPKELPDPEDKKPADWVDEAMIPDPEATQPEDWDMRPEIPDESKNKPRGWLDDEPVTVPDLKAKRPVDWDDEEDGDWEPPQVPNPKCKRVGCGEWRRPMKRNPAYKGPWTPPMVSNPAYKGPWVQKTIPNPDYHEDAEPLKHIGNIGAIAFEIWTIDDGYQFDNIYVGRDASEAEALREEVWQPKFAAKKKAAEAKAKSEVGEAERKRREKAEERAKNGPQDVTHTLAYWVLDFLESEAMRFLRPLSKGAIEAVNRTPSSVYGLLAAPVVLVLTLLLAVPGMRLQKKKRYEAAAAAAVAGNEAAGEDRKEDGNEKEEDRVAAQGGDDDNKASKGDDKAGNVKEEAGEEDKEIKAEVEEDEGTTVRRRARRA